MAWPDWPWPSDFTTDCATVSETLQLDRIRAGAIMFSKFEVSTLYDKENEWEKAVEVYGLRKVLQLTVLENKDMTGQ